MLKQISFLGTSTYTETLYVHENREFRTQYFPVAAAHFFQPDHLLVLATREAEERHGEAIRHEVDGKFALTFRRIPSGRNAGELWSLFTCMTEALQEGDDVIFDITLGFRSIPLLATIAATYLRVAREIRLRRMIYGAYDARDEQDRAPVFDLTPFVSLLDWTTATHLFLETGNAEALAERLDQANWSDEVRAEALARTTAALRLARADEARELAFELSEALEQLTLATPESEPFGLLLERVRGELSRIAPEPTDAADIEQELREEYALIRWNFRRGQILSAITVACEWMVSLLCWNAGWVDVSEGQGVKVPAWRTRRIRDNKARKVLKDMADLFEMGEEERARCMGSKAQAVRDLWQQRPDYAPLLAKGWDLLSNLRNDLNHAGKVHSTEPRPLSRVLQEVEEVEVALKEIYDASGLAPREAAGVSP